MRVSSCSSSAPAVLEVERQADRGEPDRDVLVLPDAEGAAEVDVALGADGPGDRQPKVRRDGAKGDAGDSIVEVRVAVSEDRAAIVLSLAALYRAAGFELGAPAGRILRYGPTFDPAAGEPAASVAWMKKTVFIGMIVTAALVLAVGGWIVDGGRSILKP